MATLTSEKKYYKSKDGLSLFRFAFVPTGDYFTIYCLQRPSLDGRDPSPSKTHVFDDGRICFVSGREPTTQARAEQLAASWAEYFLEYRRTGVVQA